jgi:hypothetical protein
MTGSPLTVGDVQHHATTIAAMASALLTGLAAGKYDQQAAFAESMLTDLAVVFPPSAAVEEGIEVFLSINKMTAPRAAIVPDGRGGYVPKDNSRVMRDGSLRDYDPAIDG